MALSSAFNTKQNMSVIIGTEVTMGTPTLADSTTAYNLRSGNNELGIEVEEGYEDYFATSWNFTCEHLNNLG